MDIDEYRIPESGSATDTDPTTETARCCSARKQTTCCDGRAKSTCCGSAATAGGGCGCQ